MTEKKVIGFKVYLAKIRKLIEESQFDKAIESYHNLEQRWKALPEVVKTDNLKKQVSYTHRELSLILNLHEAYILAEEGNMKGLSDHLEHSTELQQEIATEIPSAKSLQEFTNKRYNEIIEMYNYKHSLSAFENLARKVRKALEEHQLPEAMRSYIKLLYAYEIMKRHEKQQMTYYYYIRVKDLLRSLAMQKLISKAYEKRVHIHPKKEIVPVHAPPLPKIFMKSSQKDIESSYKKIRTFLQEDNPDKAEKLFEAIERP